MVIAALTLVSSGLVIAQPLQKSVAMVGARSGASWPLWIAKEARLYAKYGLDVELVYAVHPAPIAAVITGHAAMTSSGGDPALLAAAKDPSLVVLGGFMNKASFAMIGSKSATDMKQLAGKKIGVGRVGDPPYHMAVSLLKKFHLTARDVQWVSIGVDAAARAAALQSGLVDAALITAPAYFRLQAAGLPVLAVMLDHDDIYVSTYYLFRRDALGKERPAALAYIKAHAEAIKRFYDDKSFAADVMIKYGGTRDRDDANRVYDLYRKARVLEAVPYALKGSVDAVIERQGADLKGSDLSKMIDNSLVDQLVKEKYFETVFGPSIRDEQQRRQAQAFGHKLGTAPAAKSANAVIGRRRADERDAIHELAVALAAQSHINDLFALYRGGAEAGNFGRTAGWVHLFHLVGEYGQGHIGARFIGEHGVTLIEIATDERRFGKLDGALGGERGVMIEVLGAAAGHDQEQKHRGKFQHDCFLRLVADISLSP
jgi:ABC-type nitrate/sulfonate/bicarbonate transport system substrate-binding protein